MVNSEELAVVVGNMIALIEGGVFPNASFQTIARVIQDGRGIVMRVANDEQEAREANEKVADISDAEAEAAIAEYHKTAPSARLL